MFHSCAVPLRDNYWIHYFTYLQYTCWLSTPFSHWSITSFHTCCIILPRVTITLYRSFTSFVYFWFYLTHAKVRLRWCYLYSRTYKGTIHISLLTFLCLKLINQSSLFDVVYSSLQFTLKRHVCLQLPSFFWAANLLDSLQFSIVNYALTIISVGDLKG